MMSSLFYGLLAATVLLGVAAAHILPGKESPTAETTSKFHHRSFQSSIVLGDYLYIDGGEIAVWNGEGSGVEISIISGSTEGDITHNPSNWTYSVPISSSWTNSTVKLTPINKGRSPILNLGTLWPDAKSETFFLFDGSTSEALPDWPANAPTSNQFWQFTPSGDSGTWTKPSIPSSSEFYSFVQVSNAYYASGNGLGFALGGAAGANTINGYDGNYNPAGMVIYNDSSQTWSNVSSRGFVYDGMVTNGVAEFVPSFGPEGLLFVFGGLSGQWEWGMPYNETSPIKLDYAYMYDPVSDQWQQQKVSGNHPPATRNGCAVGVAGDNGTYEIFLYGGYAWSPDEVDISGTVALGAIYVLSLPSFHWHKQPDPLPFGRWLHTCEVAGNRQMISIGGIVDFPNTTSDMVGVSSALDPWAQGLGVFDLSEMAWKSSYDASAAPYVTPQIVKQYYNENGRYPAAWGSSTIESWFTGAKKAVSGSSHHTDEGATAGGVVGGVVGLVAVCALVFLLIRRKRRAHAVAEGNLDEQQEVVNEKYGVEAAQEVQGNTKPMESAGTALNEAPGGQHWVAELAGNDY